MAKHLSYDGLLHYKYIIQFAGARIFSIGEHLAKLQAKWLIHTPFALDVYGMCCIQLGPLMDLGCLYFKLILKTAVYP